MADLLTTDLLDAQVGIGLTLKARKQSLSFWTSLKFVNFKQQPIASKVAALAACVYQGTPYCQICATHNPTTLEVLIERPSPIIWNASC